jgi:hypothetical protein
MFASNDKSPSLAAVLAFTMLEPVGDVARVHRASANRIDRANPWRGYKVVGTSTQPETDGLVRVKVFAEPLSFCAEDTEIFEFLTGAQGNRHSERFDAFLEGAGVKHSREHFHRVEGRYFAVKNRGRSPMDFGSLTDWFQPAYLVGK